MRAGSCTHHACWDACGTLHLCCYPSSHASERSRVAQAFAGGDGLVGRGGGDLSSGRRLCGAAARCASCRGRVATRR